jgi:hypothetical protein
MERKAKYIYHGMLPNAYKITTPFGWLGSPINLWLLATLSAEQLFANIL